MEGVAFVLEEVERIFIKHFCWIGLIVYTFVDDIFDRKSREPLFFQISFRYAKTIKGPGVFFYRLVRNNNCTSPRLSHSKREL